MKNEELLHYAWQYQIFAKNHLYTEEGQALRIFKTGMPHVNAGPDFSNAQLMIDNIHWAGQVEIHLKSSDWYRHRHHIDSSYDGVILHVVWEHDKHVFRQDGTLLPTLVLKDRIPPNLAARFYRLKVSQRDIPCDHHATTLSPTSVVAMMDRALSQRLERKAKEVQLIFRETGNDPEETAYRLLMKHFGFHLNNENFYRLALGLPYRLLGRYREKPLLVEAILFGMAGFLERPKDNYAMELAHLFLHFAHKHGIPDTVLTQGEWKFLRTRPRNFPTVRLAQLAALFTSASSLFDTMTEAELYYTWETSPYWKEHYDFGKQAMLPTKDKTTLWNHLRINVQIPILMAFKDIKQGFAEKALDMLSHCPPEKNTIIKKWGRFPTPLESAADSQALIEQYTQLCKARRCLRCPIGAELLKPESVLPERSPSYYPPPKGMDTQTLDHSQSDNPG